MAIPPELTKNQWVSVQDYAQIRPRVDLKCPSVRFSHVHSKAQTLQVLCRLDFCAHALVGKYEREYECEKLASWKIHGRVELETQATTGLFFPVTDMQKLMRTIFRSN